MRKYLVKLMACPECRGDLTLSQSVENQDDIISGTLCCDKCQNIYPIIDSIPNLLPPNLNT